MTTDQKTAAMTSSPSSRRFTFILIKPTHYDDRGYPDSVAPLRAAFEHARLHE